MWSFLAFSFFVSSPAHASGSQPNFQLVGFYDLASLMTTSRVNGSSFHWNPSAQMEKSCGNAKAPYNMNIMEAEAAASGMMSTLAVVLKRSQPPKYFNRKNEECIAGTALDCLPEPVTTKDIRVGLGIGESNFPLQPMVKPRHLYVSIAGALNEQGAEEETRSLSGDRGTRRYERLLKTQFELELCLEHKVGRAWTGGSKTQLRQGFLLDPATEGGNDRKFFNGQRDSVPALIGPPTACLDSVFKESRDALKGRSDLVMTPSDIWGAALPQCDVMRKDRPLTRSLKHLPFRISENNVRMLAPSRSYYDVLDVKVFAEGVSEEDVTIDVSYNGKELMEQKKLFPNGDPNSLVDILPYLPLSYPTVGTKEEPEAYVVLLIPNWQIVEGLRRMYARGCADTSGTSTCQCSVRSLESKVIDKNEQIANKILSKDQEELLYDRMRCLDIDGQACTLSNTVMQGVEDSLSPAAQCFRNQQVDNPMARVGGSIFDGVGWVLRNPEHLFVQVQTHKESKEGFSIVDYLALEKKSNDDAQPNLMAAVGESASKLGVRNWGYTVGILFGRAPIVSLGDKRLSWEQSSYVQHAKQHSYFILGFSVLGVFLFVGFRRFPDYWSRTPQERAYYWPGRQADNSQEEPEGVDAENMEAEEAPAEGEE